MSLALPDIVLSAPFLSTCIFASSNSPTHIISPFKKYHRCTEKQALVSGKDIRSENSQSSENSKKKGGNLQRRENI